MLYNIDNAEVRDVSVSSFFFADNQTINSIEMSPFAKREGSSDSSVFQFIFLI